VTGDVAMSGGLVKKVTTAFILTAVIGLFPYVSQAQDAADGTGRQQVAAAQQNVPADARQAQADVERTVRRYGVGASAGIGLDPELLDFGVHARFGPVFTPSLQFRPGVDIGLGEVTTMFGINLDVLYTLPGASRSGWAPYAGAGPNFALSHRGFETDEIDKTNIDTTTTTTTGTTTTGSTTATTTNSRFDFGDTDFSSGFNFIAGVRHEGMFFEMKATAYGVTNVRLLVGRARAPVPNAGAGYSQPPPGWAPGTSTPSAR
jgi:hypothetical protein